MNKETPLMKFIRLTLELHQYITDDQCDSAEADEIRDQLETLYYHNLLESEIKAGEKLAVLLNEERDRLLEDEARLEWRNLTNESDEFFQAAKELRYMSMTTGSGIYSSERLKEIKNEFHKNDSYKVRYRFLSNMCAGWENLGLEHFPTEEEAILIAKLASPYFVWLFRNNNELENYKALYESIGDVWKDM